MSAADEPATFDRRVASLSKPMASDGPVPFSARVRATQRQIDADFPETARVGLLHLLLEPIRRRNVDDWLATLIGTTTSRSRLRVVTPIFRDPSKPDYENTVKEAVCAVEAAGKALFPEAKAATLGDLTKWLTGSSALVPKSLGQTFAGLYGFRSGGDGVGHGGTTGGEATAVVAEYALAVAASQIILLFDIAKTQEPDVPF